LDRVRTAAKRQGIAALEMLNIMETFPLGQQKDYGYGTVNALHAMIERKSWPTRT